MDPGVQLESAIHLLYYFYVRFTIDIKTSNGRRIVQHLAVITGSRSNPSTPDYQSGVCEKGDQPPWSCSIPT